MLDLQFRIKFSNDRRTPSLADLTVFVSGQPIWPVAGASDVSLEMPSDDLLSQLVEFWAPLTLGQTYPIPVMVTRPMDVRAAAERRWEAESQGTAEREDAALCDFEDAHDLVRAFSGLFDLPSLFLLRRGETMIVDSKAGFRLVEYTTAVRELTRLGNEIAARLTMQGDRYAKLTGLWRRRED